MALLAPALLQRIEFVFIRHCLPVLDFSADFPEIFY